MHSRLDIFDQLPNELNLKISKSLSNAALINLARTSKCHWTLFSPLIYIRQFLHHVTRGEHDAVSAMLHEDIRFLFIRDEVTDCSGREFNHISGFEYALWALDKHMWTAMLACIPQNKKGSKVFVELIAQYNKVKTDGVTYTLHGNTITESHFDFENTLLKELRTQWELLKAPGYNKDWDAIKRQWQAGVGGAQKLLPMHVVDEYCSNKSFHPQETFNVRPESSRKFFNKTTNQFEYWFSVHSKLSIDFAITKNRYYCYRSTWVNRQGGKSPCVATLWDCDGLALGIRVSSDLLSLVLLYEIRKKNFTDLQSQLIEQRQEVPLYERNMILNFRNAYLKRWEEDQNGCFGFLRSSRMNVFSENLTLERIFWHATVNRGYRTRAILVELGWLDKDGNSAIIPSQSTLEYYQLNNA